MAYMLSKISGAILVVGLTGGLASADVMVSNQSYRTHTVTVDRGVAETQHEVAAGKSAAFHCPEVCGFHGDLYGFTIMAGGDAKLVISKDAQLHFLGSRGDIDQSTGTTVTN